MAWYQLFFQFEGIAEATLSYDDWAWLWRFPSGGGDQERYAQDLSHLCRTEPRLCSLQTEVAALGEDASARTPTTSSRSTAAVRLLTAALPSPATMVAVKSAPTVP